MIRGWVVWGVWLIWVGGFGGLRMDPGSGAGMTNWGCDHQFSFLALAYYSF